MFALKDIVTWTHPRSGKTHPRSGKTHPRSGKTHTGVIAQVYQLNGSERYVVQV
ncbi:hypothetical protein MKA87_004400 [Salmonella enterica]|nr:hypothetical protein [Salmonella enterica]